jgi:hypothetical protein
MGADGGNDPGIREVFARVIALEIMLSHVMMVLVSTATERSEEAVKNLLLPVESTLKAARSRATPETAQAAQDALDYFDDFSMRLIAALHPIGRAFIASTEAPAA